jgi:hypothetical protein
MLNDQHFLLCFESKSPIFYLDFGEGISKIGTLNQVTIRIHNGCQMVYFQTKNPNLGKFCNVLQRKMLVFLRPFCLIIRPNGMLYGHLEHFVVIWYIFSRFGML